MNRIPVPHQRLKKEENIEKIEGSTFPFRLVSSFSLLLIHSETVSTAARQGITMNARAAASDI
jgi:hypothetical protein